MSKYTRQFGVYSRAAGVTVIKDTEGRPVVFFGVENMLIGKINNIMEATPDIIPSGVKITRDVLQSTEWERQDYQDVPLDNATQIGQILPAKGRAFNFGSWTNFHKTNSEMGDVVEVETTLKLSYAGTERYVGCTGIVQSLLPPVEQADEQVW